MGGYREFPLFVSKFGWRRDELNLRQDRVQFYQCAQLQLEKEKSQVDRLATLQAKLLMV